MSTLVLSIVAMVALAVGSVLAMLFAALRDFSRSTLEELAQGAARARGVRGDNGEPPVGAKVARILEEPEEHAQAILLPRVLCQMAVVVATVLAIERAGVGVLPEWLAIGLGVLGSGVLVWIFGTVIPLSIAEHAAEATIFRWAGVVRTVHVIMAPAAAFTSAIDELVRRMLGRERLDAAEAIESEILEAVEEGEREGQIDEVEREMIEGVVEFRSLTVEQIMTPRTEVEALEYTDDLGEISRRLKEIGHSRVPVYRGSLDTIEGFLYVRDLAGYLLSDEGRRGPLNLKKLLRPVVFVPETKTVRELLAEMLARRVHVAMVADEYGGTSGLVTFEDIAEEIFGEIRDEYEPVAEEKAPSVDIDPEAMAARVDARLRIDEANDALEAIGVHLPESEDYDTVGGLVVVTLGRIPEVGESVRVDGATLTVLEAAPTHVTRVRVERVVPSQAEPAQVWDGGGK